MGTLYPPLRSQDGKSVLPADIRANFEALQAILETETREQTEKDPSNNSPKVESRKKRRRLSASSKNESDGTNNENRKIQLAVATVAAVDNEIARLSGGIAELEALLLQQGDIENDAGIAFPPLPSIVPDDGQEDRAGIDTSDSPKLEMLVTKSNTD